MTLVELVLALAVTSTIGVGVAAMLVAVSQGTQARNETRGAMVCHANVALHLGSAVRCSRKVLAQGSDYLVLWVAETRFNGAPDLSELLRIERDPATGAMTSYRAPAGLAAGLDVQYDLAATDFNAVTKAARGTAVFPGRLLGTGLTAWAVQLNATTPQLADLVTYRVTTELNGVRETTVGGAFLRNR